VKANATLPQLLILGETVSVDASGNRSNVLVTHRR
jgi:hypothetical protein